MNTLDTNLRFDPADRYTADPVPHGSPAHAVWPGLADEEQMRVLWGGWPHLHIAGGLPDGVSNQRPVDFLVPPFADRARVSIVAAGDGTVNFHTLSGTVIGDASLTDPEDATVVEMGAITLSHPVDDSLPYRFNAQAYRSTDVTVYAIRIVFERSTSAL